MKAKSEAVRRAIPEWSGKPQDHGFAFGLVADGMVVAVGDNPVQLRAIAVEMLRVDHQWSLVSF